MKITFSELMLNWFIALIVLCIVPIIMSMHAHGYEAVSNVFITLAYICGAAISFTIMRNKYRREATLRVAIWLSCLWILVLLGTTIAATHYFLKAKTTPLAVNPRQIQ